MEFEPIKDEHGEGIQLKDESVYVTCTRVRHGILILRFLRNKHLNRKRLVILTEK